MRWSADLPVRLLTGGKRPSAAIRALEFFALKPPVRIASRRVV
jgi:hypothetical protein